MSKFKAICLVIIILFSCILSQVWIHSGKTEREFYQLTVYHFAKDSQENAIDNYLHNALLPALHKISIKNVGVFKNHANDTLVDKTMYVLISGKSLEDIMKISSKLNNDKNYQA